jgi:drug/metabolite transporter (DMT)-like permease
MTRSLPNIYIAIGLLSYSCIAISTVLAYRAGAGTADLFMIRGLAMFAAAIPLYFLSARKSQLGESFAFCLALAVAISGMALFNFIGFKHLPVGIATSVFYLYVVITIIASNVMARRRFQTSLIVCAMGILGGVWLCVGAGSGILSPVGLTASVGAAFCAASMFLITESVTRRISPELMLLQSSGIVFLFTAIYAAFFSGTMISEHLSIIASTPAVIAIGVLSLTSLLFQTLSIQKLGSKRVSILFCFEPAVTTLLGFLILSQSISPVQVLGIAIVVSLIFVSNKYFMAA